MIDTRSMIPCDKLRESGIEDPAPIIELCEEAVRFVTHHSWCMALFKTYFDRGFEEISVFVCEVEVREHGPQSIWVIVGDVPPVYLMSDIRNGAEALQFYCRGLTAWVAEARLGRDPNRDRPVLSKEAYEPLQPTEQLCKMIEGRVRFIEEVLLSDWKDELPADEETTFPGPEEVRPAAAADHLKQGAGIKVFLGPIVEKGYYHQETGEFCWTTPGELLDLPKPHTRFCDCGCQRAFTGFD